MQPFTLLSSSIVCLPQRNIDTDQIIPARYLKGTSRAGYGDHLFADWRYLPDGSPDPAFPLNQVSASQVPPVLREQILLAGDNFGCGSSREHAAWALLGFGFRAVISTSFADIFYNNALKNGLLPVRLSPADHQALLEIVQAQPGVQFSIDLEKQTIEQAGKPAAFQASFPVDPFAKECLLTGVDELGYLLAHEEQIAAYERRQASQGLQP
jgi:3-isopropylmalate/(R)-2-methylmalate dehydratase small subunit